MSIEHPTPRDEDPAESPEPATKGQATPGWARRVKDRARGERPKGSDPRARHTEHDGALRHHHEHQDAPRTNGPS